MATKILKKTMTVQSYLAGVPVEHRVMIDAIRGAILKNLDADYEEGIQYGMIGYYVPHRVYPAGYRCDPKQPLPFASLASRKNHVSFGAMIHYGGGEEVKWLKAAWAKTGKKLDMGACCIRFKKLEDIPLELIGQAIKRVPAKKFIAHYEGLVTPKGGRKSGKK